ncbi:MAG: leishmanolysin-related zinc metalloendopeptidase [Gemmatimonadota bacterium]
MTVSVESLWGAVAGRAGRTLALATLAVAGCSSGGGGDCSITDTCPNNAPAATIASPADGASAATGESVTFSGTANDPDDGALTGAALVWTSNLDGPIGTGATFSRNDLSGGSHLIALTATDDDGAIGADTVSLTIMGAGTGVVTITAPTAQSNGAPRTVTVGTAVTFTATATDPEEGALTGAALVWSSNVDGQIDTGTSFSTSSLSAGLHTVTLTATDSDFNEVKAVVLVIVKPANAPGYQIHIRQSQGVTLSTAQRDAIDAAVAKLETIITGDVPDIPTSTFPTIGTCAGASVPPMQESVDDVIIYLEFVPIDGPGNVVGSAGPCFARNGTALSLVGGMRFDTADLNSLETVGLLEDILVHEMMHVLGFGIFWESPNDYLEQPSNPNASGYNAAMTDTHFTGPAANSAFTAMGGGSYTGGNVVPVENDTTNFSEGSLDGHWRESVFDEEIMTPAANFPSNPLSRLTVAQFQDLGYTVNLNAADPYVQIFSVVLPGFEPHGAARGPVVDLSNDVWKGPIYSLDSSGTTRRIR